MRRFALCISVPAAVIITAMCCVSVWHSLFHPAERPKRIRVCDGGISDMEAYRDKYWLFSGTTVHGSDSLWGAAGWNRGNLVIMWQVAKDIEGEDLSPDYWQSLRRAADAVFQTRLVKRQQSVLRFEPQEFPRTRMYWCYVPLWLAWTVVSAHPIVVVTKVMLLRRHRRKRGRCVTCGYILAGNVSGTCPECGDVVSKKNARVEGSVPR